MSKFVYHPEVIDPSEFDPEWFAERVSDLFYTLSGTWASPDVSFGFDRQYDRTIDEDGNPGEYVQVWMRIEDEA